jgi:hypothetical protein
VFVSHRSHYGLFLCSVVLWLCGSVTHKSTHNLAGEFCMTSSEHRLGHSELSARVPLVFTAKFNHFDADYVPVLVTIHVSADPCANSADIGLLKAIAGTSS